MKTKLNIGLAVLAALTCWTAKSEATNLANFYKVGVGYTGSSDVYGDNAGHETRMIATIASEETRILQDRISDRINAAMHKSSPNAQGVFAMGNGGTGVNAGDHGSNVGVWGQVGYSHIRDSGNVSDFKANSFSGTVGVDYLFTPCFLAGLAVTHGRISDGKYSIRNGKYEHHSYTAALYAALIAHQFVSFDAMLGYGKVHKELDEDIALGIGADGNPILFTNGPRITGSTKSRRFVGSIFANVRYAVEMLNLWLRAGYSHVNDRQDAYKISTEQTFTVNGVTQNRFVENRAGRTVNVGNLSARLRAGYRVHDMVEPYLETGANYNVVRTKINAAVGNAPKDRRFGWMVGTGVRLFGFGDTTTGGVGYSFNKRGDLKVHNVVLDVRHDF